MRHILWDLWDSPGEGFDMGRAVERRNREVCRCGLRDKRQSLGNRIMASCLNLNCLSAYSSFERGRVYLKIWWRENAKTRTTKGPFAVYWDNDLASSSVTAAPHLTGRREIKQEVVWNLGGALSSKSAITQSHRRWQRLRENFGIFTLTVAL